MFGLCSEYVIILVFKLYQTGSDLNNVYITRYIYRSRTKFELLQALEQLETY